MKTFVDLARDSADEKFMKRALALAERARLVSPPNPWVGCVIVNQGDVVGEGFTRPAGQEHAEAVALRAAGDKTAGATAYVTLEPCCHYGRTPPCSDALVKAKVQKVVVALKDPDPRVAGKGIEQLRQTGIQVVEGICENEASAVLEPYLHQRKTSTPYCVLKAGMSLDGRIAAADGTSKWITTKEARLDAHRLRAESQAIIVGAGTVLADNPLLTVRDLPAGPHRPPLRVLLDSTGSVSSAHNIFCTDTAPTLVITSKKCCKHRLAEWKKTRAQIEIVGLDGNSGGIDMQQVLLHLGKKGIIQILVEGGSRLLGAMVKKKHFNRLAVYIGPCILGDKALPVFSNLPIDSMSQAYGIDLIDVKRLGKCVRLDYTPNYTVAG